MKEILQAIFAGAILGSLVFTVAQPPGQTPVPQGGQNAQGKQVEGEKKASQGGKGGMGKGRPGGGGFGMGGGFGQPGAGGPPGGGGMDKGRPRSVPGQVLSATLQDSLKLSPEQKKKVEELQKEVDSKLQSIMDKEQKQRFDQMREGGGPGGAGGFRPPEKGSPPAGEVKKNERPPG